MRWKARTEGSGHDPATRLRRRREGLTVVTVIGAATALTMADIATADDSIVLPLLAIAPFVTAALAGPTATAAVGVYVVGLAFLIGGANGVGGTIDHLVKVAITVGGSVLATMIAKGRQEREQLIEREREKFREYFDLAPVPMALVAPESADLSMLRSNTALGRLLPVQQDDASQLGELLSGDDRRRVQAAIDSADGLGVGLQPTVRLTGGGRPVWVSLSAARTTAPGSADDAVLLHMVDVTSQVEAEQLLRHRALHDSLTGLANRDLLVDRITQTLSQARRAGALVAVLFVDIDRFKSVNDRYGHEAGDLVLQEAADRLSSLLRQGDTAARVGGDEFVLVCGALPDPAEALDIAERVRRSFERPFRVNATTLPLTASVGVVITNRGSPDAAELLRDADFAMYQAKQSGRQRVEVFDERLHQEAARRLDTEQRLGHAVERSELRLLYQPLVDIETGRVDGVEALLRWQHPDLGLLLPDEFLEVAEDSGLIVPIGAWVMEEACRQLAEWDGANQNHVTMSVNVSPRQLGHTDFGEVVHGALARTGADPRHLIVEITEQTFLETSAAVSDDLEMLHKLGIRLSVDDFGTGYSSLVSLKRFPVSHLKVDRNFVDGLGHRADDTAIVAAILRLAQELGLTSVAEGIETEEQLTLVRRYGCRLAQGFLIGRPSTAEQLNGVLAAP
ncbi:MAG: diguanylate cyclase [Frankiales bacterium]|nr:diguanylate cyclase [Frankiales bacterium]